MHADLLKSEGRRSLAQGLGKKAEALRTEAHDEMRRLEGAHLALVAASRKLDEHMAFWDGQLKEKKILEQSHAHTKIVIDQCAGIVRSLATQAQVQNFIQRGKVANSETMLDILEAAFDAESEAIKQLMQQLEQGEGSVATSEDSPVLRLVGEHPGPSLASKRKAEGKPARARKPRPKVPK